MSEHEQGSRVRMRVPDFEVPSDDIFRNDRLDRRPQIESLTRRLMNIQGPCVIALDAPWGDGKTAFVKMWAQYLRGEQLNAQNPAAHRPEGSRVYFRKLMPLAISSIPRTTDIASGIA